MFAPVWKFANTPPPSFIAAAFQILAHDALYIIRTKPIQLFDIAKAGMIGQGHLNHLVDVVILCQICILRQMDVMKRYFTNGKSSMKSGLMAIKAQFGVSKARLSIKITENNKNGGRGCDQLPSNPWFMLRNPKPIFRYRDICKKDSKNPIEIRI